MEQSYTREQGDLQQDLGCMIMVVYIRHKEAGRKKRVSRTLHYNSNDSTMRSLL